MKEATADHIQIEYGSNFTSYAPYFASEYVGCEDHMPSDMVGIYHIDCYKTYASFFQKSLIMNIVDTQPPILTVYEPYVYADFSTYVKTQNIKEAYDIVDGDITHVLEVDRVQASTIEEKVTSYYNQLHQRDFIFQNHEIRQTNNFAIDYTYASSLIISEDILNEQERIVHILCVDRNFHTTKASYQLYSKESI